MYRPTPVKPSALTVRDDGSCTLVWGLEGSGKSHFAINTADVAPTLVYLNFDRDDSHLLARYKGGEIVYRKYTVETGTGSRAKAKAACDEIEDIVVWSARKGNVVLCFNNVENWRGLANKAYLPEGDDKPIPRQYQLSNEHMRSCVLLLEATSNGVHTILTAPAGPKWVGEQRKVTEGGEDMLEAKSWEGFDFAVQTSLYLFNAGHRKMVRPTPAENSIEPDFKALIVTAKLKPLRQGSYLEPATLATVLEKCR